MKILAKLEAQQRRELATLSNLVDDADLDRKRAAKKQLSTVAVFFIERSWEAFAPTLETFSLEAEAKKSPEELRAYLNSLRRQQPAYAWAWLRARMNARLMQCLEACVPDLLRQHPEMADLYRESLRQVDAYWFRDSAASSQDRLSYRSGGRLQMVRLGFRVAAREPRLLPARRSPPLCGVAAARVVLPDHNDPNRRLSLGLGRRVPHGCHSGGGKVQVSRPAHRGIALESAPDYGVRLGCPALRARRQDGPAAFPGLLDWVEQTFSHYLLGRE